MPYKDPDIAREYARLYSRRTGGARRQYLKAKQIREMFFADKCCEGCSGKRGITGRRGLHLHHIEQNTKISKASHIWYWGTVKREAEIAKCAILCSSCHSKIHNQGRCRDSFGRFIG